jgi:radical SAM superfamily enzyme YgiQ (UPF0313 family)
MKVCLYIASLPEDDMPNRQFPLGIGYVAAYLERSMPGVEVKLSADIEEVIREKPDILGISSVSQCFNNALAMAQRAKRDLDIPVLLGGYHISSIPHKLPKCFDAGIIGEGEKPFLNLVQLWQQCGEFEPSKLAQILGICFHKGDKVVITSPGDPVAPLDDLPYPKRNISPGARNIFVFSSRGCIYRCKYCASTRHWRNFRSHSADYFVNELRYLHDVYQAKSIHLLDDLFFADRKRVARIISLLDKQGLLGSLSFDSFIASNLATRETLLLARDLGFKAIKFGAETGSDRLLKEMKGPQASVKHHQRCIDLCQELGFEVRAPFMFGTPGETVKDLELTYQFLKHNKGILKIHGFYLTTPVPGTPYWDQALAKGLVNEDMDWDRLNLDYLKGQAFDMSRAIYLNEENVPLEVLKEYFQKIKEEFDFHKAA